MNTVKGEGMVQQSGRDRLLIELQRYALALVVSNMGLWTDEADSHLRGYVAAKGLSLSEEAVATVKMEASRRFHTGREQLFLCTGQPCERRMKFDGSEMALQMYSEQSGVSVTATACQGPCKQAPVATLRVGQACEMFAEFAHPQEWAAVLAYAGRARQAGTLLVDPGAALPYRFDPAHDHEKPSAALEGVGYLVGHFEGTVHLPAERRSIRKELIGSWEAGGRFLGLRMGVTYQRDDGRSDRHQALVLVAPDWERGGLVAHAFTDGATVHEFRLESEGGALTFPDRVPHGVEAVSARKVLVATGEGFAERLEFDRGLGIYETYYTMSLHRRNGAA